LIKEVALCQKKNLLVGLKVTKIKNRVLNSIFL